MKNAILYCLLLFFAALASGQQLDNAALTGDYGFIRMTVEMDANGGLAAAHTMGGVLSFDGEGGFTFEARSGAGAGDLQAAAGSGGYAVESSGVLTLANPLGGGAPINARIGAGAEALTGSTTETRSKTEDFFAAVKLPSGATDALAAGDYTAAHLSIPGGSIAQTSSALIEFSSDAAGALTAIQAGGHSAAAGDRHASESAAGSTYSLTANGSGTATVGEGSTLISGGFDIFVSETGNYILGHANGSGGRSIFAAVRSLGDGASNADFKGNFWFAELNLELDRNKYLAGVGGLRADGEGRASTARRTHEATADGYGSFDDGFLILSEVADKGLGRFGVLPELDGNNFGVGALSAASGEAAVNGFVGAQIRSRTLPGVHGILFGVRMPAAPAEGEVFLAPQGVLNAAAFAPHTWPVSPGVMVSLFGSGLAPMEAFAEATPLPRSLAGVSVAVNGVPAPLFFVSASQINLQMPFFLSDGRASLAVTNNGVSSNEVFVPVSATSPGIFSVKQNGLGHGIVTHADYSAVNESNPATPDEFIIIFLTGLGAVHPAFTAGAPAPEAEPLARTVDQRISIEFGGEAGRIVYAGAAPGYVGLYQINVQIPSTVFVGPAIPLSISTGNAFIDYADIAIGM